MRYRRLGRTEFRVSEIGFGGWGLGMDMWRGVDQATCRDAVAAGLEQGVNFYDTALAYGWGVGERLVGSGTHSSEVVVATKIPPKNGEWPGRAESRVRDVFPSEHVRRCVMESIRHVGKDTLPLVQLHVWHDAWLSDPQWSETRRQMADLRASGLVQHWGVSVGDHAPDTALRILEDELIETVQVVYNIFDRSAEARLFPIARQHDTGVIARCPFDEGSLTGMVGRSTEFPVGDWRRDYFRPERLGEVEHRVRQVERLACQEGASLASVALRFCLSNPAVSTVVPGMRRRRHVLSNVAVSDGSTLDPELLESLRGCEWKRNWYAFDTDEGGD